MLISEEYRRLNAEMHATKPSYGTSGGRWAPAVVNTASLLHAETVLDYGCGRGTLKLALPRNLDVREYDPAIYAKSGIPEPADLVVCGDVLEHIEPECLEDVLDDIRQLAIRGVFVVVATEPAQKHLPDGRNAHLIVQPVGWWLPRLMEFWAMREFKDFRTSFVFVGETVNG